MQKSLENITVKVDVDGVIRNSFQVMCDLYNDEILPNVEMMGEGEVKRMTVDDITDYDVEVSFPEVRHVTGRPAKKFFFEQHAKEVFGTAPAYEKATDAIRELHNMGARIEICSYQPTEEGRDNTIQFLKDNDIVFDAVHFTNEKWRVKSDWIIDDCLTFLNDENETAWKICIDRPFNQSFSDENGYRMKSLWDAVQFLKKTYS